MNAPCALTAVILTLNEADNIAACLGSLGWVEDIILLDSGSTDGTVDRARRARSDLRVFEHHFEDFGAQRNWALDHCQPRHEWVFFVDADERINADCEQAIRERLGEPGEAGGFYLCARNFFLGRWIKRSTFYPSWQVRLVRQDRVRFEKMGHGQTAVSESPFEFIAAPYDHYPLSKGVAEWIERHNRYSTQEAGLIDALSRESVSLAALFSSSDLRRRQALKRLAARFLILRPILMFLYAYLFRLGFLDGRAGLVFCCLRAAHEVGNVAKVFEYRMGRQGQGHQ